MRYNLFQIVIIVMVAFMFLADIAAVTVDAMSMKQIESLFQQETGQQWSEASTIQKKKFLRKMRKQEKYEDGKLNKKQGYFSEIQNKEDTVSAISTQQSTRTVPFAVRASYENQKGLSWEDATEDEQKQFLAQYEVESQQHQIKEESWKRQEEQKDADAQRKREAEKAAIAAKKQEQARKKQEDVDKQRMRKEESRRKMEELRRKKEEAIQKSKSRHGG